MADTHATDGQHAIWLVVKPTIGLPLLLGSVAITALLVHYAILTHTTWFSAYWQGGNKGKSAISTTTEAPTASLAPAAPSNQTK
jgi:light-harvesting protein B-800-850 alpha chain